MATPDNLDGFSINVAGVQDLVENPTNKIQGASNESPEGVSTEKRDVYSVDMEDSELLKLRDEYEKQYAPYEGKLKPRVDKIRESYVGKRPQGQYLVDTEVPIAANIQWEATETFLAAALASNPEPVVRCDNTPEGIAMANAVKTMLQFHSDQLVIRRKLTIMVRQWAMDLLGGLKPGWDARTNDVAIDNVKIRDYVFDPKGYVDAYGDFSSWFGERKETTADKLIELFPKHKAKILEKVDGKLGTEVIYTEWWPNDEFCFYTFKDLVLDKHKNPHFNYPEALEDALGNPILDELTRQPKMTEPRNHFAHPKKPGIFLSVYSLQEQPHDMTSNMEQNIANQNRITRRTDQIDYNLSTANNSFAFSEDFFNQETAKQAANARKVGNPILIPSSDKDKPIDQAIMPLDAQGLPADVFNEVQIAKDDVKASWGIQGITPDQQDEDETARGMILRQSQDASRIGGGIGQSLEQVVENAMNWLVQLYCVYYDEPRFASVMGSAKAIEYVEISNQYLTKQLIVTISPDSMLPKDDTNMANLAQNLFDKKAIGPLTLLKMLDFPDPEKAAADGLLYAMDPMAYMQLNFPDYAQMLQQKMMQDAQDQAVLGAQAKGMETAQVAANTPPEQNTEPAGPLNREPASSSLSQVPLTV